MLMKKIHVIQSVNDKVLIELADENKGLFESDDRKNPNAFI
jgi:hypothetical protein